jgi:hypothetical protein
MYATEEDWASGHDAVFWQGWDPDYMEPQLNWDTY